MANQTREARRGTQLTKSLQLLLSRYLDSLLATYLSRAETIKRQFGETSWNFLLFDCDVSTNLEIMDYPCRPAIAEAIITFFEKQNILISKRATASACFLITVDLEKRAGLITDQLCLEF